MLGHFYVTPLKDGICILVYAPRDITEAHQGVPQAGFAFAPSDAMGFDESKLAAFLNAAAAASHGDFEPMTTLCPPPVKSEAA